MRSVLYILTTLTLLYAFVACDREEPISHGITTFNPQQGGAGYQITIKGFGYGESTADVQVYFNGKPGVVTAVNDTILTVTVPEMVTTGTIGVSVRGRTVTSLTEFVVLSGSWVKKTSLPVNFFGGPNRFYPLGFVIEGKLYAGIGKGDPGARPKDWYSYDPGSDVWTRKADIPLDDGLIYAISFSIGNKGYMGIGTDGDGDFMNVFLEYDPANDKWTRKKDFPGAARMAAAGFSVGGKGYVGLGEMIITSHRDWWEYDPAANAWSRKADNPGPADQDFARGFVMNDKIYLGLGLGGSWWEFSPASNAWTRKSDLPVYYANVSSGGGFVLSGKGYIIGYSDCWRYDPGTDRWEEQALYGNHGGVGLAASLGTHGYYINGGSGELWEFTPAN